MARYITTKANFTLRKKHKKGSGGTIYESDYTTINPMPNALKGEYVIGDSNFVFTTRLGINAQKKHVRGKYSENPIGDSAAWTIDTLIDSGITEETKLRIKPNYTSLSDFACYGSAEKLVQGTINGIIMDFPAEMFLSKDVLNLFAGASGAGYGVNEDYEKIFSKNMLYNEYGIDITTTSVKPESVTNQLRFFSLCGSSYVYIEDIATTENGKTKIVSTEFSFDGFSVSGTSSGSCFNGKDIEIDKLAEVELRFKNDSGDKREIKVYIFRVNESGELLYGYDIKNGENNDITDEENNTVVPAGFYGGHIRPKTHLIESYFRNCDDFTAVLLERTSKPIYTATFKTPRETDNGYVYDMVSYTWPSMNGGYNPDLSGAYFAYVEKLIDLSEYYDEYHSDNMWRSLTHEAIKTLDWTYISSNEDELQDLSTIDTSRIEPITKIYGRQFDDLKRYTDSIKSVNIVTYDQKSNIPDYLLSDSLENSGWETKTLKITNDKTIRTEPLYSGLSFGYTAIDANTEFLRRLKLNSDYLLSVKGTRKGLDAMLALFGFTPDEYKINEYVCVFSGSSFPHFCNSTEGKTFPYPLAKDVATINRYKINFDGLDPYGDYCGIPVTEVGYFIDGEDYSYVVPWYSRGKRYDDGLYFQMNGGWGRRRQLNVNLEIAPNVSYITEWENVVPLFTETQARMKFAKDFDELLQQAYGSSNVRDVFYVTDVSDITNKYTAGSDDVITDTGVSHYFVLENEDLNQFLGYSDVDGKYGWRSISTEEIQDANNYSAGTLVLYLESIVDDTTGNNPHIGNGKYDGGESYISGMSHIFNYSLVNKNFIGIDDETCESIKEFVFDAEKEIDNRKCWFFSDDYNESFGKHVVHPEDEDCEGDPDKSEVIRFREVDMTDKICAVDNCNDRSGSTNCNKDLAYDYIEELSGASQNSGVVVGNEARSYMLDGEDELYSRLTELHPFDPENRIGPNGEAAANSIVNLKNMSLNFNLPKNMEEVDKEAFKQYIETSVMPYLTQMIPSTTLFEWGFCCDDVELSAKTSMAQLEDVYLDARYDNMYQVETDPITYLTAYGELDESYTALCAITAYGEAEQTTATTGSAVVNLVQLNSIPTTIMAGLRFDITKNTDEGGSDTGDTKYKATIVFNGDPTGATIVIKDSVSQIERSFTYKGGNLETLELANGTKVEYTITKPGYSGLTGNMQVNCDENTTKNFINFDLPLSRGVPVKSTVIYMDPDQKDMLVGAWLTLPLVVNKGSAIYGVNEDGWIVSPRYQVGREIEYELEKTGYESYKGTFIVGEQDSITLPPLKKK